MLLNTPPAPEKPKAVPYEPMAMLAEWHKATGQLHFIEEPDAVGRKKTSQLALELIREEFKEVSDELLDLVNGHGNRVKLAKELADLLYVTYRAADVFEIPLQAVFKAVHESNLTKVDESGMVQRRPDGKILKGNAYVPPDIASIVLGGTPE